MIIGFRSPLNERVYGVDELEALADVMPVPILRTMLRKEGLDERHSGPAITVTGGLGCPRKTLIHRGLPTTPDPTKMWSMLRGTWLHEHVGMALGEEEGWWTEETAPDKCVYEGKLFGTTVSCKVDALKQDYSELWDWKFRKDGAEKFIDPEQIAKVEDQAQLNMARLLIEQVTGQDLSQMRMSVWVMAGATVRTEAPHISEWEIGRIKPGGGRYTVAEIFSELDRVMNAWREAAEKLGCKPQEVPYDVLRALVKSMPMVGEFMYVNRKYPGLNGCTQYCEVKDECFSVGVQNG